MPHGALARALSERFATVDAAVVGALEEALTPFSLFTADALRPFAIVLAGLIAGAGAAIVSHPADLLLTRLCGSPTAALNTNVAECVIAEGLLEQVKYLASLGVRNACSGLGPRLAMTSIMS